MSESIDEQFSKKIAAARDASDVEQPVSEPQESEAVDVFELDRVSELDELKDKPSDDESIKAALAKDGVGVMSGLVDLTNVDITTLLTIIDGRLSRMSAAEKEETNPSSHFGKLIRTMSNATTTAQAELATEALLEAKQLGHNLQCCADTAIKDVVSSGKNFKDELSGETATMAFHARLHGLKKVFLHNSGFHIVIRPLAMNELNEFYRTVDNDADELGRIMGGHFYLIHDLFLKKKLMDILPLAIVSTNLAGGVTINNLRKHISLADYDTILGALCATMYKKGFSIDRVCANGECNHIEENVLLDINRMRMVNMDLLNDDAVSFLLAGDSNVSTETLRNYRSSILSLDAHFDYKQIRYHLDVPTIEEYFNYMDKLFARIITGIGKSKSVKNTVISSRVVTNFSRCFIPWITRISMLNDDGAVDFTSTSLDPKQEVLDTLEFNGDDAEFTTNMQKYIKKSQLSKICYDALPCTGCGRQAEDAVNNLKAWDMGRLFFDLASRTLGQMGLA